ncbi:chloramphenicol phosphotransferase CPT [Kitasatospora sp. NPDC051853]|uniref:chloramphenicol phosphotransferase CPT n=1 Tax=Kitasatospora sp. NPDC051853 TaxID=3364058 RepID=UPI0037A87B02
MTIRVIILNGGSSSGKSSIVRELQEVLPEPWLAFGIDGFVDALPARLRDGEEEGITFAADGGVDVGAEFRVLEAAWAAGVVATARAGARVVVDDVFLGQAASQLRWQQALEGTEALWVGVRCEAGEAARRERLRGDRTEGMAAQQAELVHVGVRYDLEVDTTRTAAADCAAAIAARVLGS